MNAFELYYPADYEYSVAHLTRYFFKQGYICAKFEEQLTNLRSNPIFAEVNIEVSNCAITACDLSREQLSAFLQLFGGKWDKHVEVYYPDKIRYEQTFTFGPFEMKVIAAQVPPPPSCTIVEEEVEVPARREKRKKIVCPDNKAVATIEETNATDLNVVQS